MPRVQTAFRKKLDRRTLLRGAGVALALPWLEAMQPAFARESAEASPRRFVAVSNALGFHAAHLFPEQAGADYEPSPYLRGLEDLRGDMTVFSGVSHPGVNGGHQAEASILTAAPMKGGAGSFKNSISLDQLMAKHLGGETRFPSLVLNATGPSSPSYTENGSMIPALQSASGLFAKLFVDDSAEEQAKQVQRLREGRSIMDIVTEDAHSLERDLGAQDRVKLDAYFTSVRDLELRLAANEDWVKRPKPKVDAPPPTDDAGLNDLAARERTFFGVIRLALETDSTRFITLHSDGIGDVQQVAGVHEGYHALSHHGLDAGKIEQLGRVEKTLIDTWADFLRSLKSSEQGSATLLDRTMALLTSNLGNASAHDTKNMPVLLAGGGFRHGQHLAFDRKDNYPLPNLYVQMLQRMGLETRSFVTSTAESVAGFETA
ncbi:MAG: DUF1552 domain-containing protein [Acidobacteria bacterium]|nr:DUF1552 domain-containing protein [Acidobacteriota bacterium]